MIAPPAPPSPSMRPAQRSQRSGVAATSLAFLLWQMTRASFLAEEKNSVLGLLWHLLNPLAMTAVLYITFSSIGRPGTIEQYPLFILIGVIHFNFFANATTRAAEGMLKSRNLVLNTTVPLGLLVMRHVCIEGLTLAIELVLVCVLIAIGGRGLGPAALWYGVVMVGLFMLTFGTGLLLATLVVFATDVTHIWSMATRMLFFLTPIFYSTEGIESTPLWIVAALNPLAATITMARASLLYGHAAAFWSTMAVVVGPLAILVVGWSVFQRFRRRLPDYI